LKHLSHLFDELTPLWNSLKNADIVTFSIFFHDIIYDSSSHKNEEKSAEYARIFLTTYPSLQHFSANVFDQIIATKKHTRSSHEDTNFFTDADLAILGQSPNDYQTYTAAIREEYRIYPDFMYKKGRKKVLQHFLNKPFIYHTDYFRAKYEERARENLLKELGELKG
jgi:predicted metal-dependent HD superfamily phosphohydrolase